MIELIKINNLKRLLEWRKEVIEAVFGERPSKELMMQNEIYYKTHLADGTHLPFIALEDGIEAGCGSICLYDELPSPDNPSGKCGYLMNIYVRERYREMGIGHAIVRKLVEEAKQHGCNKIYLETTAEGRPVYESMGFHDLPDMMKLKN